MNGKQIFLYILINLIATFIVSHVSVDKEFPPNQKIGASVVIGIGAALFLLFGVIF